MQLLAFYEISRDLSSNEETKVYSPTYFTCTQNLDCNYLTRFFSVQKVNVLQKHTARNDQFYIYIPFDGKESHFVLLFEQRNSYGKLGS